MNSTEFTLLVALGGGVIALAAMLYEHFRTWTFEVWREGFNHGDEYSKAILLGEADGVNFHAACEKLLKDDECFNVRMLTHWGLKLFSSEAEARRRNG